MSASAGLETPLQRVHRVCADAAEVVVRELYAVDRQKEPPADVIEWARKLAVRDCSPPPEIADAMRSLTDSDIAKVFTGTFRPKIQAALVNVRSS